MPKPSRKEPPAKKPVQLGGGTSLYLELDDKRLEVVGSEEFVTEQRDWFMEEIIGASQEGDGK